MEIQPIDIPATEVTPAVTFDSTTATLHIAGECYPEDPFPFYEKLAAWVDAYPLQSTSLAVILELYYINTSSAKALLDLVQALDTNAKAGSDIRLEWHHLDEVTLMRDLGKELLTGISIPWKVVPIPPETRQ